MPRSQLVSRALRGIFVALITISAFFANLPSAYATSTITGAPLFSQDSPVEAAAAAPAMEITGGDPPLQNVVAIDGGDAHTCALLASGAVQCWGVEAAIGRTPAGNSTRPVNIENRGKAFSQISAGSSHTCGVTLDGFVMCWGSNASGELGNNSTSPSAVPVFVTGISDVASVSAGWATTCALTSNGEVWCWGSNSAMQLGGATAADKSLVPLKVPGLAGIQAVSVGGGNVCIVDGAGAVLCWGAASPILGVDSGDPVSTPQAVPELTGGATAVAVGSQSACALVSAAVQCWGFNFSGELGRGTYSPMEAIPAVAVGLESGVSALSVDFAHACAIQNGGLKCWGGNDFGKVGNGRTLTQTTPAQVAGSGSNVVSIGLGGGHSCAVLADGSARCWGFAEDGRLGTGANIPLSPPVKVSSLISPTTAVDAGSAHTCAISGGALYCWGANGSGQLGNGEDGNSTLPWPVEGMDANVTSVATGGQHSCGVKSSTLYCWGNNTYGQLGNATNDSSNVPVGIGVQPNPTVSAGLYHTCMRIELYGGDVFCWGAGAGGRLGNNNSEADSNTPVGVVGLVDSFNAYSVDAGGDHSCAVRDYNGSLQMIVCWGNNGVGQLGDGSTTNRLEPSEVRVTGGSLRVGTDVTVSTGTSFSCAIYSGGAMCWGSNSNGQLGNNLMIDSVFAGGVVGLNGGVTSISAGNTHACAVVNGTVMCWGDNYNSQLGNTAMADSPVPVAVPGLPAGATSVVAGGNHTCAIVGNDLYCWGANNFGQVGVGPWTVPQVVAAGEPQPYKLTLQVTGGGSVSSSPTGINCGTACVALYLPTQNVNLTSSPLPGGAFKNWGGDCSGTQVTCGLIMDSDKTVSLSFLQFYKFSISTQGEGTVTNSRDSSVCVTSCDVQGVEGQPLTLTANPATGYQFMEWLGECVEEDATCTRTLTKDKVTTAVFGLRSYALYFDFTGNGRIDTQPGFGYCTTDCSHVYLYGTSVTITATPDPGWALTGWTGACSGTSTTCTVSISQERNVGLTFTYVNQDLDADGISYEGGFAWPESAPHIVGRATYTGTTETGEPLYWMVTSSVAASGAQPAILQPDGNGPFTIASDTGELRLGDPNLAIGEYQVTLALTDARGSTITKEITVEVMKRVFQPLVDSR